MSLHQIKGPVQNKEPSFLVRVASFQKGLALVSITPDIEQWLKQAGYEYHCFISYPRVANKEMRECAQQVKQAIINDLSLSIDEPKVFLDESSIPGGTAWEQKLKEALCQSVSMAALCAGIYYRPKHKWCGLEWAAMDSLCERRLPGSHLRTIIPLIVKVESSIPEVVLKTQCIDISSVMLQGRRYFNTKEFRGRIKEVVRHIEAVAVAIAANQARSNCKKFQFPTISAFTNWQPVEQPAPFY